MAKDLQESVTLRRETFEEIVRVLRYCIEEIDSKADWLLFHYPGMKESQYLKGDQRNRQYVRKLLEKAQGEAR